MDLEAMQLLNLSPIPELSEIELSTMLDQLSGLSDFNSDLTDRNVEDIIKEAEDLIDKSISSKTNESKSLEKSPVIKTDVNQNLNSPKKNSIILQSDFPETTQHSDIPVINTDTPLNTSIEAESSKHFNSPVRSPQTKVFSPGGSVNHIKSTIDSLKEFSTLIEKKLSSQSENSSPNSCKKTKQDEKKIDNQPIISSKQVSICQKSTKPSDLKTKEIKSLNKSIKLLNCFERLYQVKPVRLSANKRPKIVDKTPKVASKKKLSKDFKMCKKNRQSNTTLGKSKGGSLQEIERHSHHTHSSVMEDDFVKYNTTNNQYFNSESLSEVLSFHNKPYHGSQVGDDLNGTFEKNDLKQIQPRIEEKLIIKVLEEVKEIKDQVKQVGEGQKVIDRLNLDGNSTEPVESSTGIQRLELQFSVLKEKYDYQMGKLEAENLRLREELASQKKFLESQIPQEVPRVELESQMSFSPMKTQCLGNLKVPRNSPCSSIENIHVVEKKTKEAFCQTEEENTGKVEEEERKKTENKENVTEKKKPGKQKPFTDANVQKQRKIFEYEEQLLATVRGLQAEVSAKDKESKKLKNEIESLKKQLKKLTGVKVDNTRKCHIGTQTIGLGPVVQKTYDPGDYEATGDFEKENDDLRRRIKALEEDFELLKEKRVADLQALHQVHEEEIGKLVSKLETQSALTRHLHSLLVNR